MFAVTVIPATPGLGPAVKFTEAPVVDESDPTVLLTAQRYVRPEGHGLGEQVALAFIHCVAPTAS